MRSVVAMGLGLWLAACGNDSGAGPTAADADSGAVTGAVMGLGLAFGRTGPYETTERIYRAVATLTRQFAEEFGSTTCVGLLGCDLATPEGQQAFRGDKLHLRCETFTTRAAKLAADLIEAELPRPVPER